VVDDYSGDHPIAMMLVSEFVVVLPFGVANVSTNQRTTVVCGLHFGYVFILL
jgi:hypothetical protein